MRPTTMGNPTMARPTAHRRPTTRLHPPNALELIPTKATLLFQYRLGGDVGKRMPHLVMQPGFNMNAPPVLGGQ